MGYYFENHLSMYSATGWQVEKTLNAIVKRYVGANPPLPMTYRAYCRNGIRRVKDYRYHADFSQIFPQARDEQYVYAWAKYWSDAPATFMADVSCFGPMIIHLNGQIIFKSDIFTERYADKRNRINLPLAAGWNHFVIRFKKTRGGFGGIFGTWLGKHPYYLVMPTPEREGGGGQQEGWIFTEPMDQELAALPGPGVSEATSNIKWLPEKTWSTAEKKKGVLERLFGRAPNAYAVAWTSVLATGSGNARYTLKGRHAGAVHISVDDAGVFATKGSGKIDVAVTLPPGRHDILIRTNCPSKGGWDLALMLENDAGQNVAFASPCAVVGVNDPWLYLGPFANGTGVSNAELCNLDRVRAALNGDTYWRIDAPDMWLRPYNENALYGRWNYPLGVTLYGLLHSAKSIKSSETEKYIVDHMHSCCATLGYALWDREQYGGATALHTLLSSIDSLDDCGSFGSALLEVNKYHPIQGAREIADYVADYISNKQVRLDDGTFYRHILMHIFHKDTMWADDLYMSAPFLCRYAALVGDKAGAKFLDDAARQFLGFKKRLYMPDQKIMSHIYDFTRDMQTGVPWGRGNGWTIFSLSELLAVLPKTHALYNELLAFFQNLCEGYLALQDKSGPTAGMWHQVLTHPDAYPETSCTAMFAYAFARGVQFGWLKNPQPYADAVINAWTALNKISIDKNANIHGVCRGSEFSFSPEYYKKELLPNLNDTHGIGIVLLAGVEVLRMMEFLKKDKTTKTQSSRKTANSRK